MVESESAVCIPNTKYKEGLSQSIVTGVRNSMHSSAWLFALGDMPYVDVNTVESIVKKIVSVDIVVPRTNLGHGNPVAMSERLREELLELSGDMDAKPLLKRHHRLLHFYGCNDYGIRRDIYHVSDIL